MTNWQIFCIVAPKVVAICLPLLLAAAAFEYWWTHKRSKKKTKTIERSVDVARRASSYTIGQLEAEGFTFARIRRGTAYFVKDMPASDDHAAGEAE